MRSTLQFIATFLLVPTLSLAQATAPATAELKTATARRPADSFDPLYRFERLFSRLEDPLSLEEKPTPAKISERLIESDSRKNSLYPLEALLRLYEKAGLKEAQGLLATIKNLEDTMGAHVAQMEYVEFAEDVKAPAIVLKNMRTQLGATETSFHKELRSFFVAPNGKQSEYQKFKDSIRRIDFQKTRSDDEDLLKVVIKEVKKVRDTEYNMNDLQSGVHELRRQARWFGIYIDALDGSVNIEGAPLPFESGRRAKVLVPDDSYTALQSFIKKIGKMKDAGEYVEALSKSLVASKVSKTDEEAHKLALQLAEKSKVEIEKDPLKVSAGLYAKLKKDKVLEDWHKAFQKAEF